MGKQARLKALRTFIRDHAKANNKTPLEVAQHVWSNEPKKTRRNDDSQQAVWYFLRKGNQ